jgi:hypothetical protein
MFILETKDMAGIWHLHSEHSTYASAENARQEYFYDCIKGDYPYDANIIDTKYLED